MSTESLVYDVEKGGVVVVRESQAGNGCWKCLSICSFLLLTGATAVFALLQFRNEGQWVIQDFRESRSSGQRQELGPMTLKLQAQSLTKPAAHVVASHESKELVWNDKVAHTMIQNGMKLVDNKLVVPANGLYFVYSQVVFKGNKCPEESVLLRHIILRFSEEYPQDVPLLTAIKSLCEGSKSAETEVWYESIYQGAVFQLTKGDEISSKIDSADYLDLDSNGQVYFGVIALELGAPQQ
ncbi:tumor necrosis factor isoform X2 [Pelodiscus sinensis]|uniref:tumor necrosis factor isoform X2 n=1 Tax=Pelodiscus sinensis TaxID=13735 RepID=UPI003F6BF9FC